MLFSLFLRGARGQISVCFLVGGVDGLFFLNFKNTFLNMSFIVENMLDRSKKF